MAKVKVAEQGKDSEVHIRVIEFGKNVFTERAVDSIENCLPLKSAPVTTWISLDGIHDHFLIDSIGQQFKIHPIILGDVIDPSLHSKIQEFEDLVYIEMQTVLTKAGAGISLLKIAFLIGTNFVISFEQHPTPLFENVRNRLRTQLNHVRLLTPDYLVYLMIDAVIDSHYDFIDKFIERNEKSEDKLLRNPSKELLQEIQKSKREIAAMHRPVLIARDVLKQVSKSDSPLIREETRPYFREEWERTLQAIDTYDDLRESVSGLIDFHLSASSNRLNEVMKILAIFSTIFLPLTFLASLYGMNFTLMPELTSPTGFPVMLGIMIVVVIVMLTIFRKIKWI